MTEKASSGSSGGIGMAGALTLIFITLKLVGAQPVASWPWVWVLSPIWISICIALFLVLVIVAIKSIQDAHASRAAMREIEERQEWESRNTDSQSKGQDSNE